MKHNPYKIVQMFEEEIAEYTGAPYAVSIDSCSNALFLCCVYKQVRDVHIPSKTYLSVPQAIMHAGGTVVFNKKHNDWKGMYELKPYDIYDAAKMLKKNMYINGTLMCLSFHIKKLLPIWKGGMILTSNIHAANWFKMARYEGRHEKPYKEDDIDFCGWNMYMTPQQAAHGLAMFQTYSSEGGYQDEENGYRDLTEFTLFKNCRVIKD